MLQPLTKSWEGYRKGAAVLLVDRSAAADSYTASQETLMDVLTAWREQSFFFEAPRKGFGRGLTCFQQQAYHTGIQKPGIIPPLLSLRFFPVPGPGPFFGVGQKRSNYVTKIKLLVKGNAPPL
jgi:hypothetical protein